MTGAQGEDKEYANCGKKVNERSVGECEMSEVILRAAKEVCGEYEKGVSNPWVIGHEEVIGCALAQVNKMVNERNECDCNECYNEIENESYCKREK